RLLGVWELRADDGRTGWMEFRADGTADFVAAFGGEEVIPEHVRWALVAEDGDALTIEMGDQPGAPGQYRLRMVLTSPDALTIVWKIRHGFEQETANRFIRRDSSRIEHPPHRDT